MDENQTVAYVTETFPVVNSVPLRLACDPTAIREHFEAEPELLEGFTDEQLLLIGEAVVTSDVMCKTFNTVLTTAIYEANGFTRSE